MITSNPQKFSQYLDLQAGNIRCSAGNVALTMVQFPDAVPTVIGSRSFWHSHDRGYNSGFDRDGCKVNAEAAGYMFCKRFGVECQPPDVSAVPEVFEGRGAAERGEALEGFRSLARDMGDAVSRAIQPPQRTQNRGNGAR